MSKTAIRSANKGQHEMKAKVSDLETFNWLREMCRRENRRRKYQGRETISYSIKISDGCSTTVGQEDQGS